MKIAWGRIFVKRQVLEGAGAQGRFRTWWLPSGQRVRLLKRIGQGLYVAEPLPLTVAEQVALAQERFAEWVKRDIEKAILHGTTKPGSVPWAKPYPSSYNSLILGPTHPYTFYLPSEGA